MNPALKRFTKRYGAAADAIARLDLDQEVRENVATALTEAFKGQEDFQAELFWLLAADPLVDCLGPAGGGPCPDGRSIRVAMHLSTAPGRRSRVWQRLRPTARCEACGGAPESSQGGGAMTTTAQQQAIDA